MTAPGQAPGYGRLLVISAHAADFVWRAGGYIAATAAAGGEAHVVCLSFGERGESPGAWKHTSESDPQSALVLQERQCAGLWGMQ